jgi:hypothetical protein
VQVFNNEVLERGVKNQPGCKWIEVNSVLHSFTVDDQEHPQLKKLSLQMQSLHMCQR